MRQMICLAAALTCLAAWTFAAEKPLPAGGVRILGEKPTQRLALHNHSKDVTFGAMEQVTVEGRPFERAVRVRTVRRPDRDYFLELKLEADKAVSKGDVCLLRFHIRALEAADESGTARARVYVQKMAPPKWTKYVNYNASVTPEHGWKRYDVPFVMTESLPAGKVGIGIALGTDKPQVVEIGGVEVLNFGRKVDKADLPRTRATYPGIEPDAAWRKAAAERIDRHRKGDLTVKVLDDRGRPVAGAKVAVRMTKHRFGFGSALNLQLIAGEGETAETYRGHVFELLNRVVNENDLKWPAWVGGWGGKFDRKKTLAALKLLREKGYYIRGHCLVWPSWRHVPKSVRELKDDPAALRKTVREHIIEETTATKGLIDEWDVVNEPFSNHDIMDVCGKDVMVEWFRTARDVLPDVRLYINDYAILAAGGATDTAHQQHYEDTIDYLLEKGAPLGGIGLQSHFRTPTPPATLIRILDRFARFKLPLQITEYDAGFGDEQLEAEYMRDFMTAVFSHPAVDGFVMWGFWAGRHWRPACAMYRKDWSIKPNGEMYKKLVFDEWWTNADVETGKDGACTVRGFRGEYDVTVTHGGKKTTAKAALPDAAAEFTIHLGK